jgi:hypothetical protein
LFQKNTNAEQQMIFRKLDKKDAITRRKGTDGTLSLDFPSSSPLFHVTQKENMTLFLFSVLLRLFVAVCIFKRCLNLFRKISSSCCALLCFGFPPNSTVGRLYLSIFSHYLSHSPIEGLDELKKVVEELPEDEQDGFLQRFGTTTIFFHVYIGD